MKRVYLEITNACNMDCDFCTYEKGHNYLSLDEIKDYVKQIKAFCNYIYLHVLGEPLLHKDFEDILNVLDDNDMNLQLVTNGTLLYKYPDILKHKCLRKLSISLHSINNVEVSNRYFETINNLIENNNNKTIELRFYNKNNLDQKLNNYLNYLSDKYGLELTKKDNSYRLKENVYVYFEEYFRWPDINDEVIGYDGTCLGAIDMISINSKSEVSICCLDPKGYNSIGNLKESPLSEILESQKYKDYINSFKNHKIISELCSKCSYRLRFK